MMIRLLLLKEDYFEETKEKRSIRGIFARPLHLHESYLIGPYTDCDEINVTSEHYHQPIDTISGESTARYPRYNISLQLVTWTAIRILRNPEG